jgi:hypothetical protein
VIFALLRAGLRTRAMVVLAVGIGCALMRVTFGLTVDRDWTSGEGHAACTVIVLGIVIPTFVALLGCNLLRGEHAPWSWTLARPIGRTRTLASLACIDVVTIATCVATMALIFNGIGPVPQVAFENGLIRIVLPLAYVSIYLASAIGGARGMASLRAGLFGIAWVAVLVGLARILFMNLLGRLGLADGFSAIGFFAIALLAAALILIGVAIPFTRAAATVPALPRWRALITPPLVTFAICMLLATMVVLLTPAYR